MSVGVSGGTSPSAGKYYCDVIDETDSDSSCEEAKCDQGHEVESMSDSIGGVSSFSTASIMSEAFL